MLAAPGGLAGALAGSVVLASLIGIGWLLLFSGKHKTIKYFSSEGAVFADGIEVPFSDLVKVVYTTSADVLTWIELKFTDGRNAVFYRGTVLNFEEIQVFVSGLDCEQVRDPSR